MRTKDKRYQGLTTRRDLLVRGSALAAGAVFVTREMIAARRARAATGDAAGKQVEYMAFGLQFEYQVALVAAVQKKAEEAGLVLNVIDGKGDASLQTTQILDAISKQPNAMLINPVDATLLIGGVKKANEANIPVFIMENAPPEGRFEAFVDFNNEKGGAVGAEALAGLIGGSGTVLECRGGIGSAQAQARFKGFNDRMASTYPNITVESLKTEWVADNAYSMVLDAFTRLDSIAGIWSHNDEMVRGIISALRQIDRLKLIGEEGHIPIVGLDGTPLAHERIREGTQDASVGQDPNAMGGQILGALIDYIEGDLTETNFLVDPLLVTRDNVDDPTLWGNFGRS